METIDKKENFWNWIGVVTTLLLFIIVSLIIGVNRFIEWSNKKNFVRVGGIVSNGKTPRSSYIEISFVTEEHTIVNKSIFMREGTLKTGQQIAMAYNPKNLNEFYLVSLEPNYRIELIVGSMFLFVSTILFILALVFKNHVMKYDGYTLFRDT